MARAKRNKMTLQERVADSKKRAAKPQASSNEDGPIVVETSFEGATILLCPKGVKPWENANPASEPRIGITGMGRNKWFSALDFVEMLAFSDDILAALEEHAETIVGE